MFRRKGESIEVVTQKEMKKSFKRIDGAFPAVEEDDLLLSILYHGIQMGGAPHGGRPLLRGLRCRLLRDGPRGSQRHRMGVVFEKGILSGGKCVVVSDGKGLKDILEEVLG